jgi:hypothetical protein
MFRPLPRPVGRPPGRFMRIVRYATIEVYSRSSDPDYLKRTRSAWLRVDRLLGEMGIRQDNAAGHRRFAEAMEARRGKDEPVEWKLVRRGWFLGGAVLRGRLLEMMEGGMGWVDIAVGRKSRRRTEGRTDRAGGVGKAGMGRRGSGRVPQDSDRGTA